jgi:hypothetical protein
METSPGNEERNKKAPSKERCAQNDPGRSIKGVSVNDYHRMNLF